MGRTALITGVTGQDGFYLAELLLSKGYTVHGLIRSYASGVKKLGELSERISLIEGDLTDQASLDTAVKSIQPDEVYNLAAQSFVAASWAEPVATGDITALGALRLLEAIRRCCPDAKVFQASSAEIFGNVKEMPQNEETPFGPRTPYGAAKAYAYWMTVNYRDSYNIYCCNGILFNHESPRRGIEFVTRKITDAVARIHCGLDKELRLGNLDAYRDWGFAGDYVRAMWLMLQQETLEDYVIATGEAHSVREFVDLAFSEAGMNYEDYVVVDSKFFRPSELNFLLGDSSKAQEKLVWKPKVSFEQLVKMMVRSDMGSYENEGIQ